MLPGGESVGAFDRLHQVLELVDLRVVFWGPENSVGRRMLPLLTAGTLRLEI